MLPVAPAASGVAPAADGVALRPVSSPERGPPRRYPPSPCRSSLSCRSSRRSSRGRADSRRQARGRAGAGHGAVWPQARRRLPPTLAAALLLRERAEHVRQRRPGPRDACGCVDGCGVASRRDSRSRRSARCSRLASSNHPHMTKRWAARGRVPRCTTASLRGRGRTHLEARRAQARHHPGQEARPPPTAPPNEGKPWTAEDDPPSRRHGPPAPPSTTHPVA